MIPFEQPPRDPRRQHPRFARGGDPRHPQQHAASHTTGRRSGRARRTPPPPPRGAWLIGPLFLLSVGAAVRLVFNGPDQIFGLCFALLLALGVLWVLVSALFPARAERTCPNCKRESLARLDPHTTQGVVCRHCGWRDESVSSFLLAEEEGPLEDTVLRERRSRRERRF